MASPYEEISVEPDNVNVHRAAAKIIVFKSRAARGSVCNVLLCRDLYYRGMPSASVHVAFT